MKNKTPKPRAMWANYYPGIVRCDETLKRAKHRADYNLPNQTVRVAVIPLDDTEAIVERAALAGTNVARKFCDQPPLKYLRQSQNPDKNMELVRAVLTAAGIPCAKRKARK
jgi:hypothetical protein